MGRLCKALILLVRETGLEPVRPCGHRILSPGCLPIPPLPQHKTVAAKSNTRVPEGQAAGNNIFTCANGLSLTRQAVAGPSFRNHRLSGKASASGEAMRALEVRGAPSRRKNVAGCLYQRPVTRLLYGRPSSPGPYCVPPWSTRRSSPSG